MYKDLSLKEKAKVIREGVRLGFNSINDILNLYDEAVSYLQESPIVSPYGQWKYPGRDTIIPSNNITMDNVNYPVLGVSDTGDTKVMMPWNDYKFRGSMVYEHPLIGNQFQLGGNTKPTFDLWYPTVPNQKNDTSSYDLRRAYNTLPFNEMEKFRTINDYHLPSVAYDEKTDTYTFLKRNGHPTLNYELDWYNSGNPDALEFRERYKLDTLNLPWRYIPNIFLTGGLVKKPEPIYNENGQVIGRRYVNKDNSKIIDSVVPQGRVNFQEFLKAKGKKARATNFEDLELFLDSLIARGYNEPLRLAFLATSYNEMDNKGAASRGIGGNGYMGFNTIRMPLNLLNDSSKQIQYILDDTEKLTPDNWTDGGSGGPYIKNLTDAFNKFWNETNPNAATLILNKANIRPAKLSDWYLRASDADLMKQYMEYPELTKEEEEQKQKKNNKLLDSFVDFILSGGLQNTPNYADGGNLFKKGGIYIKPENRGKFTALKKRTGHSASWFKAHGTPALKKMAIFALNARHWKHDNGGHLFLEDGQIFKRPQDDLTGRNILTSPILPPKSYYEQFTIPELEPKKPLPLQPLEGTYGNKYSELIPMSDGTYVNNPINKGLQLDWRTHALEFAPFLAIGAGPAIGSTATWLATSKPALYNLGRMTLGSEIGGRSVDLASNLFTGNTWGLNVGNVVEGVTGWNPNNTIVGLFITDLTNPGYAGKEGLASLAGLFSRFGRRKSIPANIQNQVNQVLIKPQILLAQQIQLLTQEFIPEGFSVLIKPLQIGADIEKQLSKNGTISRNSLDAYIKKQGKFYLEIMNDVLNSEFSGVERVNYNNFKKAVNRRLPEYKAVPDVGYADYGMDRIGVSTKRPVSSLYNDGEIVSYEMKNPSDGFNAKFDYSDGDYGIFIDKKTGREYSTEEVAEWIRNNDISHLLGTQLNTYTFESPGILGNDTHYNQNTIGHSRTYTTKEEPDVLHVMESLSDWALQPMKENKFHYNRAENGNTNVGLDENTGMYFFTKEGEGMPYNEFVDLSRPREEMHLTRATALYKEQENSPIRLLMYKNMRDNYTDRQILENLRFAAELGQTKMRYPTRETAAKIEGYPQKDIFIDSNGNVVTPREATTYGDKLDTKIYGLIEERDMLEQLAKQYEHAVVGSNEWDKYNEISNRIASVNDELFRIMDKKPKLTTKKGYSIKKGYADEHETILKKYLNFPKQYKKLFKNADVREVVDTKGNSWYEVDVPQSYKNKKAEILMGIAPYLGLGIGASAFANE